MGREVTRVELKVNIKEEEEGGRVTFYNLELDTESSDSVERSAITKG